MRVHTKGIGQQWFPGNLEEGGGVAFFWLVIIFLRWLNPLAVFLLSF